MKRYYTAFAIALMALGSPMSHAGTPASMDVRLDTKDVEWSRYAKAYIGQDNVSLEVASYKSGGKDGAILLFKGIEGPWDGKAINHRVRPGAYGRKEYVTTHQGKEWTTFTERKGYDHKMEYVLYVPGHDGAISLTPSDGASQLTTPQTILEEYQHQRLVKP